MVLPSFPDAWPVRQLREAPRRRNADQDAFLSADKPACGKRIFVGNRDDLVIDLVSSTSGTKPAPMP